MTDSRDDDEFAATADELSTALEELRDELKREQPRGPFGLPRPPSPGEVIRFADEVAIPGTIAILEVNIKLLETVQRAIRIVDTGRRARDRAEGARGQASESASRLADVSDQTLRRLEDSLSDLQSALDGDGVPEDGAAGELLSEASDLRDDVESRLRSARDRDHTLDDFEERANRADEARRVDAARDDDRTDGTGDGGDGAHSERGGGEERGVEVDVDAELETLKDRYSDDDSATPAGDRPEHEDGGGADGTDDAGADDTAGGDAGADDTAGGDAAGDDAAGDDASANGSGANGTEGDDGNDGTGSPGSDAGA
jgi:hypothetical protein